MPKELGEIRKQMSENAETIKEQASFIQEEVELWASYNRKDKELGITLIDSATDRIEEKLGLIKKDFEKLKSEGL